MKKSTIAAVAVCALCSLHSFALPSPTAAAYNWGAQLTVAGYDANKEALSGFPVLVRISPETIDGFQYSQMMSSSTGADLCFIDMSGNGLPFEIDTWDTTGTSLVWVKLPTMEQGTQFVMCWGGATPGKTVCPDNPFAGYKGVWHMNSTSPTDASGSGNNGTGAGSVALASGVVGSGLSYPNNSSYVSCGSSQAEAELTANGYTIEGWVNLANTSGKKALFGKSGFISYRTDGTAVQITTPGVSDYGNVGNFITTANEWHHFALSFIPNTTSGAKHYIDGALKTSQNTGAINNKTGSIEMWLARNQWGNDQGFVGLIDEYRLSPTIRSADWIYASRASQLDPAFVTAGSATAYEATAEPQVGIAASDVQYTNATFAVAIGSLGKNDLMTTDADWVDPLLVVSLNNDLSAPILTIPLARVSTTPVSFPAAVVPLVTNTTYYAQIQATNSFNVAGESGVVSFTTRAPGAPEGTAVFVERGFSTMTATTEVTSFGVGGESAMVRLEASTDGFATVLSGNESAASLNTALSLSVSALAANTEYALRVRIRNDWGMDAFVALPSVHTRAVPFATTGIGWAFSQDGSTIDITFGISGIYDGATGTAMLTYNGVERGEQTITGPCQLSWPNITAANGTATAMVVLSATLNGQPYTQTFTADIAPGSTAVSVSDIMEHQSAESSVRIKVGDIVTLPELSGTSFYYLGNNRFGSLDDNVLTATEPGILGVFCVTDEGSTTNTLPVIVLPEKIGSGDIYILNDNEISGGWANWDDASKWEKVGSSANDSWPKNPDDIAIAAYWRNTGTIQMEPRSADISLGALYVGNFRNAESKFSIRNTGSNRIKVVFARTDGKPALIQFCANDRLNAKTASVTFANTIAGVEFANDTVVDGGWDGVANNCPAATFEFGAPYFLLPEGKTLLLLNFSPTRSGEGTTISKPFNGGGTVWNRSAANINWTGSSLNSFAGTVRDSGHGASSFGYQAPLFLKTGAPNALAEVVGFVAANGDANPAISPKGVGIMQTGQNQGYRDAKYHADQWFTGKGLRLKGGAYQANSVEQVWGYGVANKKVGDTLALGGGLNYITQGYSRDQLKGYPVNWVEFDAVEHQDKSSLVLWGSFWGNGSASSADASVTNCEKSVMETIPAGSTATNHVIILSGISSEAVGAAGNPLTSATHPVVPWILMPRSNGSSGWGELGFASFDGDDRLVSTPKVVSVNPLSADDAVGANVTLWDRTIEISKDVTVNSLELGNQNKNKWLGTGRTLTISSGGLILRNQSSAIGLPGRTDNGSLVLGDATHPAYVWARSSNAANPNQIWAPVTAPGGFVAAYTGFLTLGGDQTGIGDEIVVNAGTLQLGTATAGCTLARKLPVRVFANATLSCPSADSLYGTVLKFDGSAGWFGKVDLASNQSCSRLYVRDYPETPEWQNLVRGTYGSSESGAEFVRDDLFTGTGTLTVTSDDIIKPTMLIMR